MIAAAQVFIRSAGGLETLRAEHVVCAIPCPVIGKIFPLEAMSEEERVAAALAQAWRIFPELSKSFEGGVSKCWGVDWMDAGSA